MTALADALRDPIELAPNRIPRFYRGGRLLEAFRGVPDPADDDRPEDWVGSATRTWTAPGEPASALGPSAVEVGGERLTLDELLEREPEALCGAAFVERAGPTLGVLVKLLDAGERLPVHCHPSREHAAALLGSRFGKTEAWLVLDTRPEATARVWAGFRERVPVELLTGWIEEQDAAALLGALVEHRVAAGDVLLIPAGTPHAIGEGAFILELQEPTDFSVVAETRGFPIDADDASLRLGWERALPFFDRRPAPDLRQAPEAESSSVMRLLGRAADPFFRAVRERVAPGAESSAPFEPAYAVGVVLDGRGSVAGATRVLELARGTTFALPAASCAEARIVASVGQELDIVWCLGPDPAALEGQPLPEVRPPPTR